MGRKEKYWYLRPRQLGSIPVKDLWVTACLKREEQWLQPSVMKDGCKHIGTATWHPTQQSGKLFQAELLWMTYYTPSYLSSTSQAQESLYGWSSRLYFLYGSSKMMFLKFTFISLKSFLASSFLTFLWHYLCADSISFEQYHLCYTDYRTYVYFKQYVFKRDGFPSYVAPQKWSFPIYSMHADCIAKTACQGYWEPRYCDPIQMCYVCKSAVANKKARMKLLCCLILLTFESLLLTVLV